MLIIGMAGINPSNDTFGIRVRGSGGVIALLLFAFAYLLLSGCHDNREKGGKSSYDLTQMKDSGELTALTLYGSTSYFIYRDRIWDFNMSSASGSLKAWA